MLQHSHLVADRLLGLLSYTMGNLDQAVTHFEDALAFCRKGFRPELAWTCCDYADTLLQRHTGYLNLSKPEVSKKIKLSALCGLSLVVTILISNISKYGILDITILFGVML